MSLSEQNLLVVDDDDAFIDEAKRLLDGRLPVERSLEGALAAIEGGQLRMVLLGPSFANAASMNAIRAIHNAAPELILIDRKSTRLNSSHVRISYAVFCL